MNGLSETACEDAIKEQIRIWVIGFGWDDLHCKWSQKGASKTAEELFQHLVEKIIPEQQDRPISLHPKAKLPSRAPRETLKLGTLTTDVIELNKKEEKCKKEVVKTAKELRGNKITKGKHDTTVRGQPKSAPKFDKTILFLLC